MARDPPEVNPSASEECPQEHMQRSNLVQAENVTWERSSGNVFADLDLEDADDLLVRADLAHIINREIRTRKWTQAQAAARTGLSQSDISRIGHVKTDGFSQERMLHALRQLGMDVEIRLRQRERGVIGSLEVLKLA